jgi:hypothetical protein
MIFSYLVLKQSLEAEEGQPLAIYLKLANYTLTSGSKDNGNAIAAGVAHSIELDGPLTVNSDAYIVRNWRVFGFSDSTVAKLSTALSFKINDNLSISPSIAAYIPLEKGGQKPELIGGFGLSYGF